MLCVSAVSASPRLRSLMLARLKKPVLSSDHQAIGEVDYQIVDTSYVLRFTFPFVALHRSQFARQMHFGRFPADPLPADIAAVAHLFQELHGALVVDFTLA